MSEFFGRLEAELRTAAARPPRRLPSVRGAAVAMAVMAALALALLPVLALLSDEERRPAIERERPRPTFPNETVVAAGVAPVAGPWQMLTYESERLADPETGEEYQPAGLACLGLHLVDPPADYPGGFGGQCGDFPRTPGFSRVQHTVRSTAGQAGEILVYGRAPERAAKVRLTARGEAPIEVAPLEGRDATGGDFYLIAVRPDLEKGRVNWIDAQGNEGSPGIELLPP
jgi:hypothetical protein